MILKVKRNNKIAAERILFEVAMFCIFSYGLLENVSIPIPEFSAVKMPLLYVGGVCVLLHIFPLLSVLKKKKYFYVIACLALLCCSLLLTLKFSETPISAVSPRRNTIRLILYLVELFFLMVWGVENRRSKRILNFLFYYVLIFTVMTDFLFFTRLIVFMSGKDEYYLVGTKFSVSYFHMNLLTLWFIRNRERFYSDKKAKRILMIGIPYIMLVSLTISCMTGFLGCVLLLVLFSMLKSEKRIKLMPLKSPVVLMIAISASVIFPFIAEQILSLPMISNLVQNILNRSVNLTGRLEIYTSFITKMEGHWLWGYGFGNANHVAKKLFGYANTQNALLQWVFQIGIQGAAFFLLLMYTIFSRLKDSHTVERAVPLIFLIYLYIILGMVEITFSMSFIIWLALLFMLSADDHRQSI